MGSLAISLCHLSAGRIDACCSLKPARSVDIAAAQLVVRERGLAIDLPDEPPFEQAPLDLEGRSRVVAAATSRAVRPARRSARDRTYPRPRCYHCAGEPDRRAAGRHRHLSLHGHRGIDAAAQAAAGSLRRGARGSPADPARGLRRTRRARDRHAGGLVLRRVPAGEGRRRGGGRVPAPAGASTTWPDDAQLRVRMGIHTGEPAVGGERYVGLGVHRAARICAAGHGGQVLVSQTARELLRDDPTPGRLAARSRRAPAQGPRRAGAPLPAGRARALRRTSPALKTAAPAPFEGREGELAEAAAEQMARRWRRPGRSGPDRRDVRGSSRGRRPRRAPDAGRRIDGGRLRGGELRRRDRLGERRGRVADPGRRGAGRRRLPGRTPSGSPTRTTTPSRASIRRRTPCVRRSRSGRPGRRGGRRRGCLGGERSRRDRFAHRPATNQVVADVAVGNGPSGVAYGEGAVWVTNSADGTVSQIDSGTGRVTRTLPAVVGASGVAVGVPAESGSYLRRPGPWSRSIPARVRCWSTSASVVEPEAVAVGAGAVWVANRADGTVSKIDPRTRL